MKAFSWRRPPRERASVRSSSSPTAHRRMVSPGTKQPPTATVPDCCWRPVVSLFGFALLPRLDWHGPCLLRRRQRGVQQLAYEDPVTGLPNLHRMREVIEHSLAKRRPDEFVAVALMDLGASTR